MDTIIVKETRIVPKKVHSEIFCHGKISIHFLNNFNLYPRIKNTSVSSSAWIIIMTIELTTYFSECVIAVMGCTLTVILIVELYVFLCMI